MKKVKPRAVSLSPARALQRFARPLLADVSDVQSQELTHKVLKVAVAIWNATTLDERGDSKAMEAVAELVATMPEHLQRVSRAMIAARRAGFSRADYLLRDLDVVKDARGGLEIVVTADPR